MAKKLSPREVGLVVFLGGLVLVAAWMWGGANLVGGGGAADPEVMKVATAPKVNLDSLDRPAEPYDPKARNLFAYYTPPVQRPVQKPVQRKPVVKPPPPPPPAPTERKPPPAAKAPKKAPPTPKFRYIGFLGPKEGKIGTFEPYDNEADLILARAGETITSEFTVLEFKYEAVVLGYTDDEWAGQTYELPRKAN